MVQTITKPQYIVEVEDDEEAIQEIDDRLGKPLGKAVRTVTTQLASIYAKLGTVHITYQMSEATKWKRQSKKSKLRFKMLNS